MKQMEVSIMGQTYVLGCPEGGETSLLSAVERVDAEMTAIRTAGRVKARERIAVLAALNLAYALAEQPTAMAPRTETKTGPSGSGTEVDLSALVRRLDQALGADGQLL